MSNKSVLLTGSNLGDRYEYLDMAQKSLREAGITIKRASGYYESEAWGFESHPFVNQVLEIYTKLKPDQLLQLLQNIEAKAGRAVHRTGNYKARNLDIDILFFNDQIIDEKTLTIPHPRLHERRFTLEPLNELMADYKHPVLHQKISKLLSNCPDTSIVQPVSYGQRILTN